VFLVVIEVFLLVIKILAVVIEIFILVIKVLEAVAYLLNTEFLKSF